MSAINQNIVVKNTGAAGTFTDSNVPIDNEDHRGIKVTVDITTANMGGGAGAMTVTIQHVDPVSGKKTTLLASASLGAIATTVLTVYPGIAVTANVSANDVCGRNLNILIDHTNANPMVYTVGAQLTG